MNIVIYLLLGLLAGAASGFLGIGGGVVIIPILVYMFGLTQHQAQGTTLAIMIPPIGLLAALRYYYNGDVIVPIAVCIAIGFFVGGLVGASFVDPIPDLVLKKIFGVFLLIIALKMIIGK